MKLSTRPLPDASADLAEPAHGMITSCAVERNSACERFVDTTQDVAPSSRQAAVFRKEWKTLCTKYAHALLDNPGVLKIILIATAEAFKKGLDDFIDSVGNGRVPV